MRKYRVTYRATIGRKFVEEATRLVIASSEDDARNISQDILNQRYADLGKVKVTFIEIKSE